MSHLTIASISQQSLFADSNRKEDGKKNLEVVNVSLYANLWLRMLLPSRVMLFLSLDTVKQVIFHQYAAVFDERRAFRSLFILSFHFSTIFSPISVAL